MMELLEYVLLGGDPWDNIRSSDTLALGSAVKKMVIFGSDTLILVSAFVFSSNTTVLFMAAEAPGRGM